MKFIIFEMRKPRTNHSYPKSDHFLNPCYYRLREKFPFSELFWSAFFRIRTGYGEIRSIFPYSVRMQENADQNNSEYGHFLRSYRASFFRFNSFQSQFEPFYWLFQCGFLIFCAFVPNSWDFFQFIGIRERLTMKPLVNLFWILSFEFDQYDFL